MQSFRQEKQVSLKSGATVGAMQLRRCCWLHASNTVAGKVPKWHQVDADFAISEKKERKKEKGPKHESQNSNTYHHRYLHMKVECEFSQGS